VTKQTNTIKTSKNATSLFSNVCGVVSTQRFRNFGLGKTFYIIYVH